MVLKLDVITRHGVIVINCSNSRDYMFSKNSNRYLKNQGNSIISNSNRQSSNRVSDNNI